MNKYSLVFEYLKLESNNPIGCGRLAPLILMINKDKRIVKELLEESDFNLKANLLSFLDYGLKAITNHKRYEELDLSETYNNIVYVLEMFNKLENKWESNGERFTKYLLDNLEVLNNE